MFKNLSKFVAYFFNFLVYMISTTPVFAKIDEHKFFRTLNKRVNDYFKENNIQKTGNWKLHLKTLVMFALFLTPYFLILTLDISAWWKLLR